MSTAVQVEIVIPESMGKIEALAKVSAVLRSSIARRLRMVECVAWEIAVFGPHIGDNPGKPYRTLVYRIARDMGGYSLCNVWNLSAYRITA